MKIKREKIYSIITVLLVALYSLHASSCASTKAAPSGGPKDTIPPVIVSVVPGENATLFPIENGENLLLPFVECHTAPLLFGMFLKMFIFKHNEHLLTGNCSFDMIITVSKENVKPL